MHLTKPTLLVILESIIALLMGMLWHSPRAFRSVPLTRAHDEAAVAQSPASGPA
ncbi:hypothetical protein M430DRAFT_36604 [Amorphotheca resinae ATCC 22711]|uniref:Uncharacterized protein n=1 Tax=Amorphotheca resinae ATCC 22711 TaxID=857342 RepID=A0A2T3AV04_AMORE|nr:hypothetical protein M430DRAFT_36604 [Amorphotheca resinae ATCC 22711]PSS12484.1 hypothetical protein M430DRAFT_36604 [Amorphotheca resinae ATCC 22711]